MYQTLQRIEEEKYKEGLHLNILLRGNLEEIAKTLNVANQEELYIVENEIKTIQISSKFRPVDLKNNLYMKPPKSINFLSFVPCNLVSDLSKIYL